MKCNLTEIIVTNSDARKGRKKAKLLHNHSETLAQDRKIPKLKYNYRKKMLTFTQPWKLRLALRISLVT